jgi:hypothetical protein
MHGKGSAKRTVKNMCMAISETSARQRFATRQRHRVLPCPALCHAHGWDARQRRLYRAFCPLPCHAPYGIFISFPFYFILFNTYIYFFQLVLLFVDYY